MGIVTNLFKKEKAVSKDITVYTSDFKSVVFTVLPKENRIKGIVTNIFKEEKMPDFTVTLTDEQWSAYQAAFDGISNDNVVVQLKEYLTRNYQVGR